MKKILLYVVIGLLMALVGMSCYTCNLKDDNKRYKSNQETLIKKAQYYKAKNGESAASVAKLTLTYNELKDNYDEVCQNAKNLGIKVKRMQAVSNTATQTHLNVVTQVKDSIIFKDSIIEKVKFFRWNDPWVSIFGTLNKDSVDVGMQSRDTLIQIIHRVPHKFWFIKWGTKAIRQEIVSKNPHTEITYTDYIELKK